MAASKKAKAASRQLSKAAQSRVKVLPKQLRGIGRRVELGEITLSSFISEIVRYVGAPDGKVQYADGLLDYLRCLPPGKVDVEWVIDLFERYAKVVLMRQNGGRFVRVIFHLKGAEVRPAVDDDTLLREIFDRFQVDHPAGANRTLFDASTQRQTIRASLYAKPIA